MQHNCKYRDEDGLNYFEDAVTEGFIEYDDWYDAYLVSYYKEKRFLFFFKKRWGRVDILIHCPYCGEKIYMEKKKED